MKKDVNIDWEKLSFAYIKTDLRYVSKWKDGKWDEGKLVEDNTLTIRSRLFFFIFLNFVYLFPDILGCIFFIDCYFAAENHFKLFSI
jgi:hypothetical protein